MIIETERLVLREMNMDDFKALYAVLGDAELMQHYPHPFNEEMVRKWIESNIERYKTFGFGLWAVCLKENNEMIGDCGLTIQRINGVMKPEIGYHIRADKQKMGYAKEAAIAVRDWTFNKTTFKEIYSYMKYTNIASAKCAESWGCHFKYEYEDDVNEITKVYVITKEEWNNLK